MSNLLSVDIAGADIQLVLKSSSFELNVVLAYML